MGLLQQQEQQEQSQHRSNNNDAAAAANNHNINPNSDEDDTFPEQHCFDPCQAYNNTNNLNSNNNSKGACIAAFQATVDCSVDQFQNTMSCGPFFQTHSSTSSNIGKFHPANYFKRNTHRARSTSEDNNSTHSAQYLYSSSSPVGPTKCEYCGNGNADECKSNLPEEYYARLVMTTTKHNNNSNNKQKGSSSSSSSSTVRRRSNDIAGSDGNGILGGEDHESNNYNYMPSTSKTSHCNAAAAATTTISSSSTTASPSSQTNFCPRPKLFFLKKRPPFALSDGWNPNTEYRCNLFEPPSSIEGMGRGKKEVRGHLGSCSSTTGGGAAVTNNNNGVVMIGGVGGGGGGASSTAAAAARGGSSMTITTNSTGGVVGGVVPSTSNGMNTSLLNQSIGSDGTSSRRVDVTMISETSYLSIDSSVGGRGGGGGGGGGTNAMTRSYSPVQWIRGWMGSAAGTSPPSSSS